MKVLNHYILMDLLEELLSEVYEYKHGYDLKYRIRILKAFILSGKETLLALREFTKQINYLILYNRTFDCLILKKSGSKILVPILWDSFISFGWEYAKTIKVSRTFDIPVLYISHLAKNKRLDNIEFVILDHDYEKIENVLHEIIKNVKGCNVKRLHIINTNVIEFLQLKNINVLDEMQLDCDYNYSELIHEITNVSDGFKNIKKLTFGKCKLSEDVDKLESIKLEHFGEVFPQLEELNLNLYTTIGYGFDKVTNIIEEFVKILNRFDQKFPVMINWKIYYMPNNMSEFKNLIAADSKMLPEFVQDDDYFEKTIVLSSNVTIFLTIDICCPDYNYSSDETNSDNYGHYYYYDNDDYDHDSDDYGYDYPD